MSYLPPYLDTRKHMRAQPPPSLVQYSIKPQLKGHSGLEIHVKMSPDVLVKQQGKSSSLKANPTSKDRGEVNNCEEEEISNITFQNIIE
jgi:hypothetical protein